MADRWRIGREIAGALCVLALIFLNFGHGQPEIRIAYGADLAPYVTLGHVGDDLCAPSGQGQDQAHHAPCHACRIGGGADLPPPPCQVAPAFRVTGTIAYSVAPADFVPVAVVTGQSPRGPPLV